MSHSFVGTTLALQHYYDITAISRKMPLMTVYQSHEKPFGQRMAVWMATYGSDTPVPEETQKRLDDALLKNRAVNAPNAMRVLDYGTSEGHSFVVTDAIDDKVSLRAWLRSHGPVEHWQALRLLEQLVSIVSIAHKADFKNLCLSSDNIFLADTERFEILTGPLGIGLHRAELLALKDVSVTADLMRHIPHWEYAVPSPSSATPSVTDTPSLSTNDDSLQDISEENEQRDKSSDSLIGIQARAESIQELDVSCAQIESGIEIPDPPEGLCPDIYSIASILYEALCARHPYFNDERDLCDAALTMVQAAPLDISKRIDVSDEMNHFVMDLLKNPRLDALHEITTQFATLCTDTDKEKARNADKIWLLPPKTQSQTKKKKRVNVKLKHPFLASGIVLVIALVAAIFTTWHIAQYRSPVDLFALPELIPAVPQGIDVVLAPRSIPPETSVYLTSLDDGTLIKIGTLPFIYRQQEPNTQLNFVIADTFGHSMQVPITVKGENGLMLVPIDVTW